jgi:hypothetical protein
MINRIKKTIEILLSVPAGQHGLGLAETLVAIAILGTALVTFIAAISAGSIAVGAQDEATQVQNLASSQMDYTKSYSYISGTSSYPTIATPSNYSLSITVSSVPGADNNIQKITVNVSREGQLKLSVSDYKVNR